MRLLKCHAPVKGLCEQAVVGRSDIQKAIVIGQDEQSLLLPFRLLCRSRFEVQLPLVYLICDSVNRFADRL